MLTKNEFTFVKDLLRDGYSQDQIRMALENGEYLNKSGLTDDEVMNIHDRLLCGKKVVFQVKVIGSASRIVTSKINIDAPTRKKAIEDFYSILPAMRNNDDFIIEARRV